MIPGKYNPKFVQGDTWQFTVKIENADYSIFNLNGYTASSQIRELASSAESAMDFYCEIAAPETGVIAVSADAGTTAAVAPGKYAWDMQITAVGGETYTILAGTLTVLAEVTRSE